MAETICVRGEGGTVFEMDLPLPPGVAQRLERGDMQRVNPDGSPYEKPLEEAERVEDAAPAPTQSASKAAWVDWAVSHGMDVEAAEDLTKAELIELQGRLAADEEE